MRKRSSDVRGGQQGPRGSLARIAEHVAEHGLKGEGPYQAARDLLPRSRPVAVPPAKRDGEAARRGLRLGDRGASCPSSDLGIPGAGPRASWAETL